MERRIFLAIILGGARDVRLAGAVHAAGPAARAATPSTAAADSQPATTTPAAHGVRQRRPPSPPVAAAPAASRAKPAEREIVVETATAQAVLTNRGGRVLHWRLKDYRDAAGEPGRPGSVESACGSAAAVLAACGRSDRSRSG